QSRRRYHALAKQRTMLLRSERLAPPMSLQRVWRGTQPLRKERSAKGIRCESRHPYSGGIYGGPSHCGQSLQSVIPIMINEPIATTTGQIYGNSSSTPTTTARTRPVLLIRAKRQPATPIRTPPFGPQQRRPDSSTR